MPHQTPSLADRLTQHEGRVLFECADGRQTTYAEVLELAAGAALRDTGRRLVFCLCDNEPGGLGGYLALMAARAVPLMLNVALSAPQVHALVDAYRPEFIWLPQPRAAEFPAATRLVEYQGYCLLGLGFWGYSIHDSLALLLSTSGSTGSPKFVRLSHENLLTNACSIAEYLQLHPQEVPISTLSPSYTYGLSILHSHVLVGAKVALTTKTFFDRGFWDFFKSVRATSFGGVPYHYEILKKLRFTRMELPSLRTLTQAGGRMDAELTREFAAHCASQGVRFFTMYGQAEATARVAYLPAQKALEKAGSIGVAVRGGALWLEDELGQVQEGADAVGELVYKGPNVFMGYAQGYADLALGDERCGVLHTGDLARRDADGDYYIVGRLKRFLKLFGHRVNLQDVEDWLAKAGHEVVCAGQDDLLEIYWPQGTPEGAKGIKQAMVQHLKVAPGAVKVVAIAEFPRSNAGKIQFAELRAQAGETLA